MVSIVAFPSPFRPYLGAGRIFSGGRGLIQGFIKRPACSFPRRWTRFFLPLLLGEGWGEERRVRRWHSAVPASSWLLAALLLLLAGPALAARIEVSLDRNPVSLNESFTLTFSTSETPDDDPDFSPLEENFDILSESQSSSFSLNNGRASRNLEWQVTVMAKRAGTLDIPPIAFGADRSEPFSVTVAQGAAGRRETAGADLLLEVEAEPKQPYVQAQVIYTLRVLSRVPLGEARLSAPEAADALVVKLESEREGFTTRHGVKYKTTELRYAIFPQKSGRLRIEPARLEAQIPTAGRSSFARFFSQSRSQRLQSDAVELDVRPIPPQFSGKHWLPATKLELEDSWAHQAPQIGSGEPITRTLGIRAEGATVGLLPELNPKAAPEPGAIKQYPDQPVLNEEKRNGGLISSRQEKTALLVSRPGTYRMPAMEIPWWNTQTDRLAIARLPERILTVLPSAHAQVHEPPPVSAAAPKREPAPEASPGAVSPTAASAATGNIWFWLALFLGLGWLGTSVAWWLSRRTRQARPAPPKPEPAPSERRLVEAIERACRANDPAAARRALADWAAQRWPGLRPDELERRAGGELGREIALLNRALYGNGGTEWRGEALWQAFKAYAEAGKPPEPTPARPELEPLYKL